jgi:adenylosuccinate lyase
LDRLEKDPAFQGIDVVGELDPQAFVGRAPQQVDEFLEELIEPLRGEFQSEPLEHDSQIRV